MGPRLARGVVLREDLQGSWHHRRWRGGRGVPTDFKDGGYGAAYARGAAEAVSPAREACDRAFALACRYSGGRDLVEEIMASDY